MAASSVAGGDRAVRQQIKHAGRGTARLLPPVLLQRPTAHNALEPPVSVAGVKVTVMVMALCVEVMPLVGGTGGAAQTVRGGRAPGTVGAAGTHLRSRAGSVSRQHVNLLSAGRQGAFWRRQKLQRQGQMVGGDC